MTQVLEIQICFYGFQKIDIKNFEASQILGSNKERKVKNYIYCKPCHSQSPLCVFNF